MGRTKGSKNGVSTTPGYVAIGQRAQNDWQQQALRARGMAQQTNPVSANLQTQRRQALLNRSAKQIQQTATDAKDRQREAAQAYAQLILQKIQQAKAEKQAKRTKQEEVANDLSTDEARTEKVASNQKKVTPIRNHKDYVKARARARKKALRARKARNKK